MKPHALLILSSTPSYLHRFPVLLPKFLSVRIHRCFPFPLSWEQLVNFFLVGTMRTPPHLFWCLLLGSLYGGTHKCRACCIRFHIYPMCILGLKKNVKAARVAVDRPPTSELIRWHAFSIANWAHFLSHKFISSFNLQSTNLFGSNIWNHFCWDQEFTLCRILDWSSQGLYGGEGIYHCLHPIKALAGSL